MCALVYVWCWGDIHFPMYLLAHAHIHRISHTPGCLELLCRATSVLALELIDPPATAPPVLALEMGAVVFYFVGVPCTCRCPKRSDLTPGTVVTGVVICSVWVLGIQRGPSGGAASIYN